MIKNNRFLITLNVMAMYILIVTSFAFAKEPIAIEYLTPQRLSISATGINRLHFEDCRILKIVGDNSRYSALLPAGGSDLFLTSKVPG